MSQLIAVQGDLDSDGEGALQPVQTKVFINGKPIAVVGDPASADDLPTANPSPVTGSSKVFIGGKAVHRNGDLRNDGATTIATGQSKVFA
jgi:uncharacterized Zn-binding protein involved in type VI secretion